MFRKLILTLGATAAIGAIALSPTAASAKHWHHGNHWHGHGWYGVGFYPTYVGSDDCYYVSKIYFTPSGKHVRRVLVCD